MNVSYYVRQSPIGHIGRVTLDGLAARVEVSDFGVSDCLLTLFEAVLRGACG